MKKITILTRKTTLTLFRMGIFGAARGWGGPKRTPLPKICHISPTMMRIGTLISYLKKIQKIYESRDIHPDFYWHQHFFYRKSVNFVTSRNTDID